MATSSRRLAYSAVSFKSPSPTIAFLPFRHPSQVQRRTFLGRLLGTKKEPKRFLDPLSPDFLKRKPVLNDQPPKQGDLADSSIFDDPSLPIADVASTEINKSRDPYNMTAALDPTPFIRQRWERKMTIRGVRGRHRMTKTAKIARTERSLLSKSHMLKTSVKKLGPLARQITGKPIEDAIVQMRFSKKKAAADVMKLLEYARDEAVVKRGMGLGQVKLTEEHKEGVLYPSEKIGNTAEAGKGAMIMVDDRKGRRRAVADRTSIYVDEAWVGRGKYGSEPDYRARGQIYLMRPPLTSISVVLKEEVTRIRLAVERDKKRQRKKVWVPLPDRPITAQRQHCLW